MVGAQFARSTTYQEGLASRLPTSRMPKERQSEQVERAPYHVYRQRQDMRYTIKGRDAHSALAIQISGISLQLSRSGRRWSHSTPGRHYRFGSPTTPGPPGLQYARPTHGNARRAPARALVK